MDPSANRAVTDRLMAPFPDTLVEDRVIGGGRKAPYVAGENVIRRLIEATGNCFDVAIRSIEVVSPLTNRDGEITGHLYRAHIALTIPGLGTREHIGVQAVDARSGEDIIKGVVTDALKKAATLFGVGLELYDDPATARARQAEQEPRVSVPTPDEWGRRIVDALQEPDSAKRRSAWGKLSNGWVEDWQMRDLLLAAPTPEAVEATFAKAVERQIGDWPVVAEARRKRLEQLAAGGHHTTSRK